MFGFAIPSRSLVIHSCSCHLSCGLCQATVSAAEAHEASAPRNDEDVPAGIVSSKTAWNCQNWRIQDQKDTCNNTLKQLLFRAPRLSPSMHIPVGTCCHAPLNTLIALAYDSALGAWKHNIQVSSSPWDSIDVIEVHYAVILQGNSPGHGLQFTCWKSGCRTVPYDVSLADI